MPKKLDRLEKKIEREYRNKGYGIKESRSIGYATANKIFKHIKK